MKIFRLLAPCFKLRTNNTWLHYANLAVDCESRRFLDAHTLGIIIPRWHSYDYAMHLGCRFWVFHCLCCDAPALWRHSYGVK